MAQNFFRAPVAVLFLLLFQGCTHVNSDLVLHQQLPAMQASMQNMTRMLAVYEPWFGHPRHISVGYSSNDPETLRRQIDQAKTLGISGFVVDWYGHREPFLDRSYALLQSIATEKNFNVAMMYDESGLADREMATDQTISELEEFRSKYLSPDAPGRQAYLTYNQRPVIFIFPKGKHTNWNRVRAELQNWDPAPLLLYENIVTQYASDFDGFYAWINPGPNGWARDGSHWGGEYLQNFYRKMRTKYPEKIAVGAAWAGFDDKKASWSLNRYMSQRCGQTLKDTLDLSREYDSPDHPLPFLLIATWNDYEEGTAIERGLAKCNGNSSQASGSQ
jgi:hypothetical protein